jgi:hypothetical protein
VSEFANLPVSELSLKRNALLCPRCKEFAWFCKEGKNKHPAHFCAHHSENCSLKIECAPVSDVKEEFGNEEKINSNALVVSLDGIEKGGFEVEAPKDSEVAEGGGSRRYLPVSIEREAAQQSTLRRILLRLVRSVEFRLSTQQLVIYKSPEEVLLRGKVSDVVVGFHDIQKEFHNDQYLMYWGPISSVKRSKNGIIWLNSSHANQSASVAIFADIADRFVDLFKVENFELLSGAHVLVIGRCKYSMNEKPVIWCANTKNITIRKYKSASLLGGD